MDNKDYTTIRISKETHDELAKLGDLSDSFDKVIRKLLGHNKKRDK